MRWGGGAETGHSQDPTPPARVGGPPTGRIITMAEVLPREKEPHVVPQLWGLALERKALRMLGFEGQYPEGCGNQRLHSFIFF